MTSYVPHKVPTRPLPKPSIDYSSFSTRDAPILEQTVRDCVEEQASYKSRESAQLGPLQQDNRHETNHQRNKTRVPKLVLPHSHLVGTPAKLVNLVQHLSMSPGQTKSNYRQVAQMEMPQRQTNENACFADVLEIQ